MTGSCQDDSELVAAYRLLMADVYELAGESRRSSEAMARGAHQTAAGWHALSVISDGPRTVSSAARRLGLARQSVQRVVDGLAAEKQVELRDNPEHVRAPLVALTAKGRATLRALLRRSDQNRTAVLERAGVTAGELGAARDVIRRLVNGLRDS